MSRVLVTGSAGVIGRALIPSLLGAGFDVRGFDRASDEELLNRDALLDALDGCEGVIRPARMGDLARAVVARVGSPSPIRFEGPPEREVQHFLGDPLLAFHTLGWRPQVSVEAGLGRLIPSASLSFQVSP